MKPRHVVWLMLLCFLPALGWTQNLPTGDPAVNAPDTLIVEDYKGPDKTGDQGGFVLATFKHSIQHNKVAQYRVWRQILTSISFDLTTGKIRPLPAPEPTWVPWAVVKARPVAKGSPPLTWAIIPTLDDEASRWAIAAEIDQSLERDKETLALLGIYAVLREAELPDSGQNLTVSGQLDLDPLRRIALLRDGVWVDNVKTSTPAVAAAAVRAVDNIPPATVRNLKATADSKTRIVKLEWSLSLDDRDVGFTLYHKCAIPMPGVRTYDIYRGPTADNLAKVASLAPNSASCLDMVPADLGDTVVYAIYATDRDNATPSESVTVRFNR